MYQASINSDFKNIEKSIFGGKTQDEVRKEFEKLKH
jgi:hypothetical protein